MALDRPPALRFLMPAPAPFASRSGSLFLMVSGVWVFITTAVIAMTAAGIYLKTGRVDVVERIIWDIGWLGWAPLTFLVVALCRRHPIDRQHRLRTVARLAGWGVGVVCLQMLFDFVCNAALGLILRGTPPSWTHLLYIAVYKAHLYYGVYWMIVGAAHAYEFHRRYRESLLVASQLETRLAQAELDRLKSQLQPHFLFNAHNTIVALILKQENAAAIRMLTRLSDLLRISLSHSGQQVVTVREELQTLSLYLDIQRERFRDRLTVAVNAPDNVLDAGIPHLLLQPLVENALLHGLENVTEDAHLAISIAREGGELTCTVSDNGAGFASERATTAGGIGISNTRDRLQQLYGSRQSFAIASAPGNGCRVTVQLPLRVHENTAVGEPA